MGKRRKLKVRLLAQGGNTLSPLEPKEYKEVFENLNIDELKKDIEKVLTDSKSWWPADFGHYGGLFVRLAWHSAGTYRIRDGRRGANRGLLRLYPIFDWPDNVNLDKAVRLLWPVKRKYGFRVSWGDLIILAGNVALESMGFKTLGFAGGRLDAYLFEEDIYYEKELELFKRERSLKENRELPTAASTMGLIYVNPEGPQGRPIPKEAALEIRESFKLMGMDDRETVALIAGGHSFGKCHGAGLMECLGEAPDQAPVEEAGFGWKNRCGTGKGPDTITSGFELTWTRTPVRWSLDFLENLFKYEWELTKSPAGLWQWVAKGAPEIIPDAYDPTKRHKPMMLTTDLALREDPIYREIAKEFLENPDKFEKAFAESWFKLTHRDLGPERRYIWKEKPNKLFSWQEPLSDKKRVYLSEEEIRELKNLMRRSNLPLRDLLYVAWSSASTYRDSDKRGGADGGKIRFSPMKEWEVNEPKTLKKVLKALEEIKGEFGKGVSTADLIVLGGVVAVEEGAKKAGFNLEVPFSSGRVDADEWQIDKVVATYLEPEADGFRNYLKRENPLFLPEELLIDKAQQLTLNPFELVALIGGLRVLGVNYGDSLYGVLTDKKGVLTNDYFKNLLDPEIKWERENPDNDFFFIGYSRESGERLFKATRFDLVIAADSELRAVAETYAFEGSQERFVKDFVNAFCKVMDLDRFDLNWR